MFRRKHKGSKVMVEIEFKNNFDARFFGHMLQEAGYEFKINDISVFVKVPKHQAVDI